MDATQVAPMPVLHSVMMLKVSEASRATSVTRAAAAAAAAQAAASAHRRNSLTLSHHALHVSAESASAVHHAAVPVTPHAADQLASKSACSASSSSSPAAAFSPREPSSKVAATSPPVFASKSQSFSSSSSIKQTPPAIVAPSTPVASSATDSAPSSPEPSPVGKRSHASTPKNSSSSPKSMKANTGRWTDAEHKLFLKGLETFPYRAWKKIATLIKTRTVVQIRTHAQKYYQKLEKEEARSKDREHQHGGYSKDASSASTLSATSLASLASSHLSDDDYSDSSASTPRASSPAKKKSMLRKRKFTLDDDSVTSSLSVAAMDVDNSSMTLPSLPKRMMKEKKFPREKHMSPKQKAPVSGGSKFFGSSFSSPELGPETAHRAVFGRSGAAAIHKIPPHPLDFDDATSESMILDFADDKSMAEYPFHLDGGMDTSISSMDNDDLLQLTDEESLDWFSTAAGDQDDDLLKVEPLDLVAADEVDSSSAIIPDCTAMDISDSSPLTLGRYHFSPLYTDECLQFSDSAEDGNSGCSSPSSSTMLSSCEAEDFILSEDDDFVLDPEKFLSSYFSPSSSSN